MKMQDRHAGLSLHRKDVTLEGQTDVFVRLSACPEKIGSAIEWIVDQYQVKKDERSGIVSDPNDPAHKKYIPELIEKIVTVSVETVRIVAGLPEEFGAGAAANA